MVEKQSKVFFGDKVFFNAKMTSKLIGRKTQKKLCNREIIHWLDAGRLTQVTFWKDGRKVSFFKENFIINISSVY